MPSSIIGQTLKLLELGSTTKIATAVTYEESPETATLDPTDPLEEGCHLQGGGEYGG